MTLPPGDWPYDDVQCVTLASLKPSYTGLCLAYALNVLAGKLPAVGLAPYLAELNLPELPAAKPARFLNKPPTCETHSHNGPCGKPGLYLVAPDLGREPIVACLECAEWWANRHREASIVLIPPVPQGQGATDATA
jgi:hypothetical protein